MLIALSLGLLEPIQFLSVNVYLQARKKRHTHALLPRLLCSLLMERAQPQFATGGPAAWSPGFHSHGASHGATPLHGTC